MSYKDHKQHKKVVIFNSQKHFKKREKKKNRFTKKKFKVTTQAENKKTNNCKNI